MSRLSWRWWSRNKEKSLNNSSGDAARSSERFEGGDRRHLLKTLSAIAGSGALAAMPQPATAKDASDLPPPKRALTGRDEAGKSVFKSFDVTSKVVEIDSNPGLTFYELYMTEGVPQLTGLEPDPMLNGTKAAARRHLREWIEGNVGQGASHGRPFRPQRAGHAHHRHHRLLCRGSRRDDAGARRRSEGPFASGRLRRAKQDPAPLAQPVAGAMSDGVHFGWRQAGLRVRYFQSALRARN
jgi:hypothetical protein